MPSNVEREMSGPLISHDFDQARKNIMENQLTSVLSVLDGPEWKTILNTPRRLNVVNDTDVRIKAGLEISKRMLRVISDGVKKSGADFAVLLLPTKEYVFWPKVERPEQHKGLTDLIQNEERLRAAMMHLVEECDRLYRSGAQPCGHHMASHIFLMLMDTRILRAMRLIAEERSFGF